MLQEAGQTQTRGGPPALSCPQTSRGVMARFSKEMSIFEALEAEASITWMIGDDLEGDIVGAHKQGMKTLLVRTGKFRPDEVERSTIQPSGIVSSIAQVPDWLEANL